MDAANVEIYMEDMTIDNNYLSNIKSSLPEGLIFEENVWSTPWEHGPPLGMSTRREFDPTNGQHNLAGQFNENFSLATFDILQREGMCRGQLS